MLTTLVPRSKEREGEFDRDGPVAFHCTFRRAALFLPFMNKEQIKVSILIAALEEERWIGHAVSAALASVSAAGLRGEVIVCDGGSQDATRERAKRSGALVLQAPKGRAKQLNAGLRAARGDWVMLLHADALCNPRMLEAADASLERGAVGGWFQVDLLPESGESTNTLRLLSWGINLRTRWFTTATADQALFTSREVLLDLGGVPDLPLMEGIALARALRARGEVVVLGPWLRISGRRWETYGPWRTTGKMYSLRLAHKLGVSERTLARFWRNHAGTR